MDGDPVPEVSVVVRCLNEAEHIGRLFDGLKEQTFRDFEIIVVDSGSTDGTLEIVKDQDDVRLLHIDKEEFSFGRSLNLGCDAASGEFLVAISAHCYPTDQFWLENVVSAFEDRKVGVVYGKQRGPETAPLSERRVFEKWFPEHSVARQYHPFCNNANCAVRRDLWSEYRYDEDLPGLEDMALALESMRDGYRIAYRADAGVVHVHDETPAQTRTRYRREAIALQRLFPREHFNLFDFTRLFTSNVLRDAQAAASEGHLLKELRGIFSFRLAQFWGAYEGFHTRWPGSSELKRHLYYPNEDG